MKKLLALFICSSILVFGFSSCVPIDMLENSSNGASADNANSSAVSTGESEDAAIDKESSSTSEQSEPPVYTPIYPADYDMRIAYYSNMTVQSSVYDSFFNDSVFVGNSIMLHYKNYASNKRTAYPDFLGNASFFAAASFSLYNNKHQKPTDSDCALPLFQGEKLNIKQAVEAMGVQTVYLSLMALNDIALYKDGMTGVNETYALFTELVEDLKGSFAGLNIVVIGNTYLHKSSSGMAKLNNGTIQTLNTMVLNYCNTNGYDFIELGEVLLDADNCLGTEFCSDVGGAVACHLNTAAYNAWTELLRDYAAKKSENRWVNPTELKPIN